uniref:Uncharacterized protein n=1 Tax=Brassica oleracea TaxID=3712 RepID=Q2A9W3_BRAOL|nr:hypothetical protein 24.t00041 [Brassica oleracea]
MTNPHVLSGELKAGRRRKTVVTHVLRSWEARNVKKRGDLMDMGLQPHNQHEQVITQSDNESLLPAFQATPLASTDNMNTCNTALYTFSFMSRVAESSRCDLSQCIHKTCLIHNKYGAQYIVGMEEYLLYKNIDKAQSRT